ncbi:MAG: hypothetical protein HOP02_15100 [Methylococcaceae bacterium]|nr:hypothetical protein [Methylococcaceae bacterium]
MSGGGLISAHSLPVGICAQQVLLVRRDLREMIALVRVLYQLSKQPTYVERLKDSIPNDAKYDPVNDSVLMGYDFHLSASGPKLIEVNNNAGGLWLAWQAQHPNTRGFGGKLQTNLVAMFLREYALWRGINNARPRAIAIIDQQPLTQFLYAEMQAFAALLNDYNLTTFILDPSALTASASGLHYQGTPIDLIYNRHCDFYLQSTELAHVRKAWLQKQLCLTPNPHTYALLADKQRMIHWSTPEGLRALPLSVTARHLLERSMPKTRLFATQNAQQIWQQRKHWVFKPDTAYASKGVYLGKKITTTKFAELDPAATLIQEYIPPSIFTAPDGQAYKTDFRLFVYQQRILSVAARLYQGQVTNLRTESGGFAQVRLV